MHICSQLQSYWQRGQQWRPDRTNHILIITRLCFVWWRVVTIDQLTLVEPEWPRYEPFLGNPHISSNGVISEKFKKKPGMKFFKNKNFEPIRCEWLGVPVSKSNGVRSKRFWECAWKISKYDRIFSPSGWSAASGRSHNETGSNQKGLECAWKIPKSPPNRATGRA